MLPELVLLLEGRLLTVGRLLLEGLLALPVVLGRTELLLLTVGRTALPLTLPELAEPERPDMLPLTVALFPCCATWLIDPAVPLL